MVSRYHVVDRHRHRVRDVVRRRVDIDENPETQLGLQRIGRNRAVPDTNTVRPRLVTGRAMR
jgi:ribosomal protein L30/L7E